jgi:hypothetical protein
MSQPNLRRAAKAMEAPPNGPRAEFARSCAIGVLAGISIGLNVAVCALTLVALPA